MKTKILLLSSIVLALVLVVLFSVRPGSSPRTAQIGKIPQDFELVGLNAKKTSLSALKGDVVLVNFWATWCGSCVGELPSIERLFRYMSDKHSFKMVTILFRDDGLRALSYMRQNGYTFPVYLNPDNSAARIFGITGVPETFILDKKGVLREKVLGPAPWDSPQAIAALQDFINEP